MTVPLPVAATWYATGRAGETITRITEPHVHEMVSANTWHVRGRDRDLFIDCGLGVASLRAGLPDLFAAEPAVALTHAHLDHMGSAHEFTDCWAHPAEPVASPPPGSLRGPELAAELGLAGPLPPLLIDAVPRPDYRPGDYRLRAARVTRPLPGGEVIDLGDRTFVVQHLPGHTPGSIALLDPDDGTLFTGDVVYDGVLLDGIAGADRDQYRQSLRGLLGLPVRVVHPGHGPSFGPDRLHEIIQAYLGSVRVRPVPCPRRRRR
jgi:glyoxylase-like metal-dependent hydrolase (beta-lactamase superfamily II)